MTSIYRSKTQYKLSYSSSIDDTFSKNISVGTKKPPRLSYPATKAISTLEINTQCMSVSPQLKYPGENKIPSTFTTSTQQRASSPDLTTIDQVPRLGYPEYPITYQQIAYTAFEGTIYSSVGTYTVTSPGTVKLTAINNVTDVYANAPYKGNTNDLCVDTSDTSQPDYLSSPSLPPANTASNAYTTPCVCCPASFDSDDTNDNFERSSIEYLGNSSGLEPYNDIVDHTFVDFVLFECNKNLIFRECTLVGYRCVAFLLFLFVGCNQ